MKLWSILPANNIREPVKATDFVTHENRVKEGRLLLLIWARFPTQPAMPIENPALAAKDKNSLARLKFASQMKVTDQEMTQLSFEHAVENDAKARLDGRRKIYLRNEEEAEQALIAGDDKKHMQILQSWINRSQLQKMFLKLRINSLDDFKSIMKFYHEENDLQAGFQNELFARQCKPSLSQSPENIKLLRIASKEEDIARVKVYMSDKNQSAIDGAIELIARQRATRVAHEIAQEERNSKTDIQREFLLKSSTNKKQA